MWIYKNKKLEEIPENAYGFVYKISPINIELFGDIYYIGCKSFYNTTNPKISKKKANELYSGKGRKPTRQKKIKESDWKTYFSSSKKLQDLIEENGKELFKFEILSLHRCYTSMILQESKLIIDAFIKKDDKILNEWISIKIRKKL
jgi:uncharacterized protein YneF (UPF0154 family)